MHVVRAVSSCIAAVLVAGCLGYMSGDANSTDDGGEFSAERTARGWELLQRECRSVDDVIDGVRWENVEAWRIRACDTYGCDRAVPSELTVYVRRIDNERARHEYVHACLFSTGKVDGHHEWMRHHCRFCYGSPACSDACD